MKNDDGVTEHTFESWKSVPMRESDVSWESIQIGAMVIVGEHHYKVIRKLHSCMHTGELERIVALRPAGFENDYRFYDDQDSPVRALYVPVSFRWAPGVEIYEPT